MSGVAGVSGEHRRVAAVARQPILARCDRPRDRLGVPDPRSDLASCHWRPPRPHVGSTTAARRQRRDEYKGAHHCGPEGAQKAWIKRRHAVRSTGSIPAPSECPVPPASRAAGAARRSQGAKATSGNSLVTVGQILMASDRGPVCEEAAPHGTVEDRPIAECRLMIRGVWSIPPAALGSAAWPMWCAADVADSGRGDETSAGGRRATVSVESATRHGRDAGGPANVADARPLGSRRDGGRPPPRP